MKGRNVITINQATLIEAVQQYFDVQMKGHVVLSVKSCTHNYSSEGMFDVEFSGEEAQS